MLVGCVVGFFGSFFFLVGWLVRGVGIFGVELFGRKERKAARRMARACEPFYVGQRHSNLGRCVIWRYPEALRTVKHKGQIAMTQT